MRRYPGTKVNGQPFPAAVIEAVWKMAMPVPGQNQALVRQDACGATILRFLWGDHTLMSGGWEIDHIIPVSMGGTDDISNLQPLHWQNNRAKGEGKELVCVVPVNKDQLKIDN